MKIRFGKVKAGLVAGLVAGVAASAIGVIGIAAAKPTPDPDARVKQRQGIGDRGIADQHKLAGRRGPCGKIGMALGKGPHRLVHDDAKFQLKEGFGHRITDHGKVTAVDPGAKRLTVRRADGETVSVTASEATKVCKDGRPADVAAAKVDDHARVLQFRKDGDQTVVRFIGLHSPGADKPPAGR